MKFFSAIILTFLFSCFSFAALADKPDLNNTMNWIVNEFNSGNFNHKELKVTNGKYKVEKHCKSIYKNADFDSSTDEFSFQKVSVCRTEKYKNNELVLKLTEEFISNFKFHIANIANAVVKKDNEFYSWYNQNNNPKCIYYCSVNLKENKSKSFSLYSNSKNKLIRVVKAFNHASKLAAKNKLESNYSKSFT
ncbi:MAG TPA: hypothetical protein QF753_22525 [Victivallales bacterium]|nr:hypothetical protein [Victivallales bacterium]